MEKDLPKKTAAVAIRYRVTEHSLLHCKFNSMLGAHTALIPFHCQLSKQGYEVNMSRLSIYPSILNFISTSNFIERVYQKKHI